MTLSKDIVGEMISQFKRRDADGAEFAILDMKEIKGGWERPIYSFTIAFQRGERQVEEKHVLRTYLGDSAGRDAQKDFTVMTHVQQKGVPTPALDFVVTEARAAYLSMEYIEGEQVTSLRPRRMTAVLKKMAHYQASLHKMDFRNFWDWREVVKPEDYLDLRMARVKDQVKALGKNDFDATFQWIQARLKTIRVESISLLHNDYHPENVIAKTQGGGLFVIDWGFAAPGEPRMDLAWTLLQISLMLGSKARSEYLHAYELEIGKMEDLDFFEVLKFTERMATIATWLQPGVEPPIPKIDKKAIRSNYRVHVLNVYRRLKKITGQSIGIIEALEKGDSEEH